VRQDEVQLRAEPDRIPIIRDQPVLRSYKVSDSEGGRVAHHHIIKRGEVQAVGGRVRGETQGRKQRYLIAFHV